MSGLFFWILVAYSFAGLLSGIALGPEWLRTANSAGVHHATMLAPGVVFLGVAVIFRLAILKRGAADAVARFFSLLGWAAIFGAAAQSGAGWLGRWPGEDHVWAIHAVLNIFTLVLVALAFLATLRVSMASNLMVFKIPGTLLAGACGATVVHLLAFYVFGLFAAGAWAAGIAAVAATALWTARMTPSKPKESQQWRVTKPRPS